MTANPNRNSSFKRATSLFVLRLAVSSNLFVFCASLQVNSWKYYWRSSPFTPLFLTLNPFHSSTGLDFTRSTSDPRMQLGLTLPPKMLGKQANDHCFIFVFFSSSFTDTPFFFRPLLNSFLFSFALIRRFATLERAWSSCFVSSLLFHLRFLLLDFCYYFSLLLRLLLFFAHTHTFHESASSTAASLIAIFFSCYFPSFFAAHMHIHTHALFPLIFFT